MATNWRVLAVGGDRAVLVGLARAFQRHGCSFAANADPARLLDSAVQFSPHVVLVFAHPSPDAAMQRVALLRSDPRFLATPIFLVASLPPRNTAGVSAVLPDPSDVGEFASRVLGLIASSGQQPPAPPPVAQGDDLEELSVVEEIESFSARLLLVDDDPALVKLFSIMMRKSGFEVFTAEDGQAGLGLTLDKRPDLVLADLNMPRLDGWGLLRAIRADHRVGETPVVFLSAHDDYRESLKALASGAQDYARIRGLLAPRDAFLGALAAGERVGGRIQEIGVQWALRQLAGRQASGVLQLRDEFWTVAVGLADGELVFARSRLGPHDLAGLAALPPMLVLRSGDLLFDPAVRAPGVNVQGQLAELLEQAAIKNNTNEAMAIERLLTQASRVEVDPQLYSLYEQLGPPSGRPIAALVKQGLTPCEVLARVEMSPTEVEDTLRDLVRRRVLQLSA
jgi:CheY-like chemotaxis protein